MEMEGLALLMEAFPVIVHNRMTYTCAWSATCFDVHSEMNQFSETRPLGGSGLSLS